ncbi:MAG: antitoxin Xre/MbcA/ParS toxin-binding domain-containing protein [Actinomycetota bacterium]
MAAIAPFLEKPVALADPFEEPMLTPAISNPEAIRDEIEKRNLELARQSEIPDDLGLFIDELADQISALPDDASLRVDPYLLLAAQRALIGSLRALDSDDVAWARKQMRVRLEQMRQVYRDLAEGGPVYEDQPANEIARWLDDVLDVPQARLAQLFGVSARTFQRWISASDSVGPEGEDARRVRVVARVVNHLRHVLTGPGVVRWFEHPNPQLEGGTPLDLLDDPEGANRLDTVAASARSHTAA